MQRLQGWSENGNGLVQVAGQNSSNNNLVQSSYPGSTITVFIAGSNNLATIFSDNNSTPLANPFTASNNGGWFFYAGSGRYDVNFSGTGITTPFTLGDFLVGAIQKINNQAGENQNLLVGNTGTDFAIVSANNNHSFNLPTASASNRGALSASDWGNFNNKSANLTFSAPLANNNGNITLTVPLTFAQGGTNATTKAAAFNSLSPQANKGDLIAFDGNNGLALPVGANNLLLIADATNTSGVRWGAANLAGTGFTGILPIANGGSNGNNKTQAFDNLSPTTTKGDILAHNNNNIVVRIGVGANNQALLADSSNDAGVRWGAVDLVAGVTNTLAIGSGGTAATTKNAAFDALSPAANIGDLITRNNATGSRLPVGADGQVLVANSSNSLGLLWGNQSQAVSNFSVSFNNASFVTSSNNAQFTLFTLGQFQKITGVTVKPANLLGGGAITDISLSLGSPGNSTLYTSAFSVGNNGVVGNTNFQDTALFKSGNMGGATAVLATFLATGNNFGNGVATFLTGGNVSIWIAVTTLQ